MTRSVVSYFYLLLGTEVPRPSTHPSRVFLYGILGHRSYSLVSTTHTHSVRRTTHTRALTLAGTHTWTLTRRDTHVHGHTYSHRHKHTCFHSHKYSHLSVCRTNPPSKSKTTFRCIWVEPESTKVSTGRPAGEGFFPVSTLDLQEYPRRSVSFWRGPVPYWNDRPRRNR